MGKGETKRKGKVCRRETGRKGRAVIKKREDEEENEGKEEMQKKDKEGKQGGRKLKEEGFEGEGRQRRIKQKGRKTITGGKYLIKGRTKEGNAMFAEMEERGGCTVNVEKARRRKGKRWKLRSEITRVKERKRERKGRER